MEKIENNENNENHEVFITPSSEEPNEKKPTYKRKRIIVPVIIGIVALVAGITYGNYAMTYVSTDDAYVEGHNVQIAPKIAGNVIEVYVDDNQNVKQGKLIAEIDPRDYQVRYDQAMAKLQAAEEKQRSASVNVNYTNITSSAAASQAHSAVEASKASMNVADKQISQAKASLAEASQDIDAAKAELSLAQIDFDRYSKLYKKGVVSKQDYDKILTNYKTIQAKYNSSLEKSSGLKLQWNQLTPAKKFQLELWRSQ